MAASIASSPAARHDDFLSDLARSLAVAARPKNAGPTLSRGAFIRGRWAAGHSSTTTGPLSGLIVSDDAVPVGPADAVRPLASVPDPSAHEAPPRRLQDIDPKQLAEHHRRAIEVASDAKSAELTAVQATQAAAVLQLRADAAAVRAAEAHELGKDEVEALELAEETALSAAAVARAVAAAATQAAATATAAASAFENEVATATQANERVAAGAVPPPRPPSAPPPSPQPRSARTAASQQSSRADERAPESAEIS